MSYKERAAQVVYNLNKERSDLDAKIAKGLNDIWLRIHEGLARDRIDIGEGYVKSRLNENCTVIEIYYPASNFWRWLFGLDSYNKVFARITHDHYGDNDVYMIDWGFNNYMYFPLKSKNTKYVRQEPQDDFEGVIKAIETKLCEVILPELMQKNTGHC